MFLLLIFAQCKKENTLNLENSEVQKVPENKDNSADDNFIVSADSVAGAWFSSVVPEGFKAKSSFPSSTSVGEYDSYFYISPDEKVQFYVFSPQWTGSPNDIIFPNEKIKVNEIQNPDGSITREWTLEANRQTPYIRSFTETKSENTILITGFYYKDQAAYEAYKSDYEHFINSIQQYSD